MVCHRKTESNMKFDVHKSMDSVLLKLRHIRAIVAFVPWLIALGLTYSSQHASLDALH
jgi:hypothetical protein